MDNLLKAPHLEQSLPPADIAPPTKLPADFPVDPNRRKAQSFVERDTGGVWQRYASEGSVLSQLGEAGQKFAVQRFAEAFARVCCVNVNSNIRRASISFSGAMGACIGISADLAGAILRHQPELRGGYTRADLLCVRRRGFEADPGFLDEGRIDLGAPLGVSGASPSDDRYVDTPRSVLANQKPSGQ